MIALRGGARNYFQPFHQICMGATLCTHNLAKYRRRLFYASRYFALFFSASAIITVIKLLSHLTGIVFQHFSHSGFSTGRMRYDGLRKYNSSKRLLDRLERSLDAGEITFVFFLLFW